MHFDDRLATVLRQPVSGDATARIQFRQLVDILGRLPARAESPQIAAAFARLEALSGQLPAADRARLLRQPLQPLRNARLLWRLAQDEPAVASAAIGSASLGDAEWLHLIPRLPIRARGILRHRRDLSPSVEALLERLGIGDRALPPAQPATAQPAAAAPPPPESFAQPSVAAPSPPATEAEIEELVLTQMLGPEPGSDERPIPLERISLTEPTSLAEWARMKAAAHQGLSDLAADRSEAGIGAIVRRIEEFRKARESHHGEEPGSDSPRLPLGDMASGQSAGPAAIDFSTSADGRIDWAEGPFSGAVVGFLLEAHQTAAATAAFDLAAAVRHRMPIEGARITLFGSPVIAGEWQADAIARFDPASGRFLGYYGRLRRVPSRPAAADQPALRNGEADRMRQVLHELRTPANAIQVAAEIVQQQLYGPAPHEYRALAAAIAGDCAHILAGFEELDRLVKLETGAMRVEPGECDLAAIVDITLARLRNWSEPRNTGFALAGNMAPGPLPIAIDEGEAERLIWRLLAALAGATGPGESLPLAWRDANGMVRLRIGLPEALRATADDALFETREGPRPQSLWAGMFGIGFTLRLAAAEAAAADGSLEREGGVIVLSLPGLTLPAADNSTERYTA